MWMAGTVEPVLHHLPPLHGTSTPPGERHRGGVARSNPSCTIHLHCTELIPCPASGATERSTSIPPSERCCNLMSRYAAQVTPASSAVCNSGCCREPDVQKAAAHLYSLQVDLPWCNLLSRCAAQVTPASLAVCNSGCCREPDVQKQPPTCTRCRWTFPGITRCRGKLLPPWPRRIKCHTKISWRTSFATTCFSILSGDDVLSSSSVALSSSSL